VDEPETLGGIDSGPTPQQMLAISLASCTAITVEMYAERKRWDVGRLEVEVDYESDDKGQCARFDVLLKLPDALSKEQVERILTIAAKCPVHQTLSGDVAITDRAQRI
jgi:putative redox protein